MPFPDTMAPSRTIPLQPDRRSGVMHKVLHAVVPFNDDGQMERQENTWNDLLTRYKVFYVDEDGDEISIQTFKELLAAIKDLDEQTLKVPFMFQYRVDKENAQQTCRDLEVELRLLQLDITESGSSDRDIAEDLVITGPAVEIGRNINIGTKSRQVQDLVTPEVTPVQSPLRSPASNHGNDDEGGDTPIIDLPCIPNQVPHPPLTPSSPTSHNSSILQPTNPSQSIPSSPPPASPESPDISFPGTFPQDLPTESSIPNLQEVQATLSKAFQSAMDTLAQLGHRTITAAQNTGFPISNPTTFDQAHATIDQTSQNAIRNIDNSLDTAGRNVTETFENARTNLEQGYEAARTNLEQGLETARTNIDRSLNTARTNLATAQTRIQTSQTNTLVNLSTTLNRARATISSASRQVDRSLSGVTRQLTRSGSISEANAEKVLREVRNAAGRMERAVDDVTLKLQRRINATAQTSTSDVQEEGRDIQEPEVIWQSHDHPESSESAVQPDLPPPPPPPTTTPSVRVEDDEEEDIYGAPSAIPGSFPEIKSKIEECADALIEMGYFKNEERDSAGAVSVVAEGDLTSALEIMEGRGE